MPDEIRRLSDDLARDPSSLVFMPLADALRRAGQLDVALRVALRGLDRHPVPAGRPRRSRAHPRGSRRSRAGRRRVGDGAAARPVARPGESRDSASWTSAAAISRAPSVACRRSRRGTDARGCRGAGARAQRARRALANGRDRVPNGSRRPSRSRAPMASTDSHGRAVVAVQRRRHRQSRRRHHVVDSPVPSFRHRIRRARSSSSIPRSMGRISTRCSSTATGSCSPERTPTAAATMSRR